MMAGCSGRFSHAAPWPIAASLLATLALAIVPAAASAATATTPAAAPPVAAPTPTPTTTPGACPAGAEVLATTAGAVAERIYAAEVKSAETESDKRQIESYAPLLEALERRESAAIEAAVHSLVYSHTHIVRLRVDRGSELLSDIGGPYILAPVSGLLRAHGKTIGHFVFSVQDDLGYVKLVTRFLGVPLVMRGESGQIPIEGLLSPGPATIPDHGPVSYRRRRLPGVLVQGRRLSERAAAHLAAAAAQPLARMRRAATGSRPRSSASSRSASRAASSSHRRRSPATSGSCAR